MPHENWDEDPDGCEIDYPSSDSGGVGQDGWRTIYDDDDEDPEGELYYGYGYDQDKMCRHDVTMYLDDDDDDDY